MTPLARQCFIFPMMEIGRERRRYGRIRLDEPLRARYGDLPVRVTELSLRGFLIAHEGRVTPGMTRHLKMEWDHSTIELECTITRSTLHRLAKGGVGEQSIYLTGLRITGFANNDFESLRNLIGERVLRALAEQKANAHGIPPLAAYMYQPEKGELYRRCEIVDGKWRKTETTHPQQPSNGFTISAEVDPYHVSMLCDAWERTTAEGRRLTQLLAELSISRAEGVPTRRYVP